MLLFVFVFIVCGQDVFVMLVRFLVKGSDLVIICISVGMLILHVYLALDVLNKSFSHS